jgi:hypothetical protein
MRDLVQRLLPHAPDLNLFVAPHIPAKRIEGAMSAYGQTLGEEPLALFDATLLGNGRSGLLFGATALALQNGVETPQRVAYRDLIDAAESGNRLFGKKVALTVNRGKATFEATADFSASAGAAEHVVRFLKAAIAQSADAEFGAPELLKENDALGDAVERVVQAARAGALSSDQMERLRAAVTGA